MTPEPVPSPLGGIESAASVAPGSSEREPRAEKRAMNIEQVESMKAHIVTDSGAVIYIERTDAVSDAEWASALAMIDRADSVIDAAREVVENWPTNRLAESVRLLDGEVQEFDAAVEEFMPDRLWLCTASGDRWAYVKAATAEDAEEMARAVFAEAGGKQAGLGDVKVTEVEATNEG